MAESPPPSLETVLGALDRPAIAVSGGIDSTVLAVVAGRLRREERLVAIHAVSPAVPKSATDRVRRHAAAEGWDLRLIDAGEFADARYMSNPSNRCFFCKSNLYATMAGLHDGNLVSGTNRDDLGDIRPGLKAAAEQGVRHPYVEAMIGKAGIRALARDLDLHDLAALPAAPCLSSRVETSIPIDGATLSMIDAIESRLRGFLGGGDVRCRVRRRGVVLELDPDGLARMDGVGMLRAEIESLCRHHGFDGIAGVEPYRRGSAFLGLEIS